MVDLTESELATRSSQLDLFVGLVDSEKASQAARSASIDARASVLVGASAVVGALKIGTGLDSWEIGVLVLSFAAAVIGLYVTRPRRTWGFGLARARESILTAPDSRPLETKLLVADEKVWQIAQIEPNLRARSRLVSVGYVILALSIVATLVGGFVTEPPTT